MIKIFTVACLLFIGLFSLQASYAAEVYADLTCTPPTTRMDGAPLDINEIGGYRFYESIDPLNLMLIADVNDASLCAYTVMHDLAISPDPYTYYYAVTAYDQDNRESAFSEVVTKSFLLGSTAHPSVPGNVGGSMRCGPGCVVTEQ